MTLPGLNMNMLNMNGMFGMNNCGTNFFAGGCNNMLGSIFGFGNNAFYNPCDGTYDYDAMAGWGVASTLANIGLGILDQHMASKQAEKAQPSLSDQIADVDAEIQKEADRIGVDADQVANYDVSNSEYQTKVTEADNKHKNAIKAHNKSEELADLEREQTNLNNKTEKTEEDNNRLNQLVRDIATKKLDVERDKKAEEDAKLALDTANEKLEAHKKTVKEVQTKVANLQAQKAKLEKQQEAQDFANAAKKADGNIFTRDHKFNVDDFNTKMADDDSTNNPEIGQRQLKALIYGFTKKDATEAEKKKYAKALQSLNNTEFYALKPDKNQEMIWKAAKEYKAS